MTDFHRRITLALVLFWGAAAPLYHRIGHFRAEASYDAVRHVGHDHGSGHAIDALPADLPHDLVCACVTNTLADLQTVDRPFVFSRGTAAPVSPADHFENAAASATTIRGPPTA